ncbi:MAG: ABC transporter permease [Blautia sp.]|nr:ABC transporter permease [Blautia sp.]
MTKRKMFLRMITASLLRRRSRMLIALLSIAVGATILSGLVTIYIDVPRQMGAQFRSYGANMIILPGEEGSLTGAVLEEAMQVIPSENIVGATPYRYVRLDMPSRQQSFTTAGTDFDEVRKTSPYFSVEGEYPQNRREIMVGKEVAETIGVRLGSSIELSYKPLASFEGEASADWVPGAALLGSSEGFNEAVLNVSAVLDEEGKISEIEVDALSQTENIGSLVGTDKAFLDQFLGKSLPLTLGEDVDALSGATISSQAVVDALNSSRSRENARLSENKEHYTVAGILSTGGEEEAYIYMSLEDLTRLTQEEIMDVAELSVSASAEELEGYAANIQEEYPALTARLVKRLAKSEASVLSKLQALVFLVTAVVLALTLICVSTTMMAVVSERRREIGLRKALGASDGSIRHEFLGEGMFLGGLGGLLGGLLGFAFAQMVSVHVFGSSITFQPLLLPITIIVSMAISAVSCQLPIKKAVAIDPAIVLKGE